MAEGKNLDRFVKAGLLTEADAGKLSADKKKAVESLSDDEVSHLISGCKKLGADVMLSGDVL